MIATATATATGPRTDAGKAKSRGNALKHGLSGHGVVLPTELADVIQERKDLWRKDYRPDGPAQEWLFERLCVESVLADRCTHLQIAALDELSRRAAESWDDDRRAAVAELAAELSTKPDRVQPLLLGSRHGCEALISAWEQVERTLRELGGWRMLDWHRVLDLQGVPKANREGRNPGEVGPGDAYEPGLRFIAEQIAALRARLDGYLIERDERQRADAEAGLIEDAPELRRLKRYEGAILRRMQSALKQLRALQKGPAPEPGPGSDSDRDGDRGRRSRPPAPASPTPPPAAPAGREVACRPASPAPAPAPAPAAPSPLSAAFRDRIAPAPPVANRRDRRAREAQIRRAG